VRHKTLHARQAGRDAAVGGMGGPTGIQNADRAAAAVPERPKTPCYMRIMTTIPSLRDLSDQVLLAEVKRLAVRECQATADLIASLAELDARRLYLGEGCASLFTYCTEVLHLSEHAAYRRIEAARAARRFPLILDRLAEGAITLTAVGLLAPHFTADTHRALLDAARHRSKREIEQLVFHLHPQPDVPASVRRLPATKASGVVSQPPVVTETMLAPERQSDRQSAPPGAAAAAPSVSMPVSRPASSPRWCRNATRCR
jgi:hypothetical protein